MKLSSLQSNLLSSSGLKSFFLKSKNINEPEHDIAKKRKFSGIDIDRSGEQSVISKVRHRKFFNTGEEELNNTQGNEKTPGKGKPLGSVPGRYLPVFKLTGSSTSGEI